VGANVCLCIGRAWKRLLQVLIGWTNGLHGEKKTLKYFYSTTKKNGEEKVYLELLCSVHYDTI